VCESGEHGVDETRCETDNSVGRSIPAKSVRGYADVVQAGALLVEETELGPNSTTSFVELPGTFETETFTVVRVLLGVVQRVQAGEVVDVRQTLYAQSSGRVSQNEGVVGSVGAYVFTEEIQVAVEEIGTNADAEGITLYIVAGVLVGSVVGVCPLAVETDLVAFADVESVGSGETERIHHLRTERTSDERIVQSVSSRDGSTVGSATRTIVGLLERGLLCSVESRRVNPL
jgi:hypothetical protein